MDASPSSPPDSVEAERDALRIQAAAVAAQHVALALEEERQRQKAAALERQEAQLASHLEERRQKLLDLQEQVRKDREVVKAEAAAAVADREALRSDLVKEHAEVRAAGESARKERLRLVGLRKRLRQRWRRHWDMREAELKRRESELSQRRGELAGEAAGLQRERAALSQKQTRVNGEVELGRRKLQEGWEDLALTQQEWDTCLNYENTSREQRAKELDAREASIATAEQNLAERERAWARKQELLAKEIEGLENRVRNGRARIATEPDAAMLFPAAFAPTVQAVATPPSGPLVPADVQKLAADLNDQRRHLLEQWSKLLSVQGQWEGERQALFAELEAATGRLDERERQLAAQDSELAEGAAAVRRRHEAVDRLRGELEGRRARLVAREAACESEHASLLADARSRGETAEREASRLQVSRQRAAEQRQRELEELQGVRARCEEVRSGYLELLQDSQARRAELTREERELATRALSVERLRQEILSRAPDAAAGERRLSRLEHRNRARLESYERELAKGQKALLAETERLTGEWKRFQEEEKGLLARQEELTRHLESCARSKAEAESDEQRRRDQVRALREGHARDLRELAALRAEIELIAHNLIDDGEDGLRRDGRQAA
jgi:hypothetical protein